MNTQFRKELIVKSALDVLQNILPTNIMENLERLNEEEDSINMSPDDLDEERFIYEHLAKRIKPTAEAEFKPVVKTETVDNSSLTYFEIVEQEMMQSLPVTKENIKVSIYREKSTQPRLTSFVCSI